MVTGSNPVLPTKQWDENVQLVELDNTYRKQAPKQSHPILRGIMIKRYALNSSNIFSENKYVLIREYWFDGKLMSFNYEHSKVLPEGFSLK